ncbi:TerD family protein [Streptomyces sp. NPDC093149]|uniref:TerD family protein n=1 Tax=Streptomyces sp. NPDC093149 TaxID=3366031 RepID=UPI0037FFBB51
MEVVLRAPHVEGEGLIEDAESGQSLLESFDGLGGGFENIAVELYRHTTGWKARAVGQGYDTGLAGLATDYGIDVEA